MLKDGTSEVWPESVEKIFVDGAVIAPSPLGPSYLYVFVTSQGFANTGSHLGLPIPGAVADGGTSFLSITSRTQE